jgi:tRNA dimethylallyltransferase
METKPLVLVILGPTASGKSDLAVRFARALEGDPSRLGSRAEAEIISADSRQVYRGLDLGSGKITAAEMAGIPHHLLDVADPREQYSVAEYQKLASAKISEILQRGKLPIVCGGTGLYIRSLVDNLTLPEVPPNLALRQKLENQTTEKLFKKLAELDPERAATIDRHNPRRLVRALEIATALGRVPPLGSPTPKFEFAQLGVSRPPAELRQRIHDRLIERLDQGLIEEVENLKRQGLTDQRLEALGLEYRYVGRYLAGKLSRAAMVEQLELAIVQYAKRQLTWFRRDPRIYWLNPEELARLGTDGTVAAQFRTILESAPGFGRRQNRPEEA